MSKSRPRILLEGERRWKQSFLIFGNRRVASGFPAAPLPYPEIAARGGRKAASFSAGGLYGRPFWVSTPENDKTDKNRTASLPPEKPPALSSLSARTRQCTRDGTQPIIARAVRSNRATVPPETCRICGRPRLDSPRRLPLRSRAAPMATTARRAARRSERGPGGSRDRGRTGGEPGTTQSHARAGARRLRGRAGPDRRLDRRRNPPGPRAELCLADRHGDDRPDLGAADGRRAVCELSGPGRPFRTAYEALQILTNGGARRRPTSTKTDRIRPSRRPSPKREIVEASIKENVDGRDIIKKQPFERIRATLATAATSLSDDVPAYDPAALIDSTQPIMAPDDTANTDIYGAEVEGEVQIKTAALPATLVPPETITDQAAADFVRPSLEAPSRRATTSTRTAPTPARASRPRRRRRRAARSRRRRRWRPRRRRRERHRAAQDHAAPTRPASAAPSASSPSTNRRLLEDDAAARTASRRR